MSVPSGLEPALPKERAQPVWDFIAQDKGARYVLNERVKGSDVVQVCRPEGPEGKLKCFEVHEAVTSLFALFQKEGYFCQLPFDPSRTEIECTRIDKIG